MVSPLKTITSVDAARTLLDICGNMSSLKLQKMVYLAHENHIGETDMPLIEGDVIEAWSEGPVFENLSRLIGNSDEVEVAPKDLPNGRVVEDDQIKKYFKLIHNLFKDKSGKDLSDITHLSGSPWRMARKVIRKEGLFERLFNISNSNDNAERPVISDCMIRHHFQSS